MGNIILINVPDGTVTLTPSRGAQAESIISCVTYDSEFFYLERGENRISYNIMAGGADIAFLFFPRYVR